MYLSAVFEVNMLVQPVGAIFCDLDLSVLEGPLHWRKIVAELF